ncbi:SPL family radical SAM protein [Syntrophothermus lipocalidus]|uniref:Radical SAM domain protein n=1 Tax=Syntrophothermus lipocalidus (strain DSM 12680 / TGB-C1) TaxID=643648 RepID=D7CMG6_SYNLT|nr:radical SAM protein [Syntrophothermus lipocalidus]ADI01901.1 Radical SAM domain protein [Syntrophothermus lipocalidus DSM 12680]
MLQNIAVREILCKSALNKTGVPGYQYCINPYVGCAHACVYCYASFMCRFTNHLEKWGRFLDVKVNFPEVLAKQLGRRNRPEGAVLVGSVTDAYQPAEAVYEITRSSLRILADYQLLEVHTLTKSSLVLRDLPLLRQMRGCEVGFTITTLDRNVARVLEPGASPPHLRLAAARELIRAGIKVWVFIAPLLPGVSDREESLTGLLRTIHECGIREVLLDTLNPYPAVVQRLKNTYLRYFPEALPELETYLRSPEMYRDKIEARLCNISELVGCQPYFV